MAIISQLVNALKLQTRSCCKHSIWSGSSCIQLRVQSREQVKPQMVNGKTQLTIRVVILHAFSGTKRHNSQTYKAKGRHGSFTQIQKTLPQSQVRPAPPTSIYTSVQALVYYNAHEPTRCAILLTPKSQIYHLESQVRNYSLNIIRNYQINSQLAHPLPHTT